MSQELQLRGWDKMGLKRPDRLEVIYVLGGVQKPLPFLWFDKAVQDIL